MLGTELSFPGCFQESAMGSWQLEEWCERCGWPVSAALRFLVHCFLQEKQLLTFGSLFHSWPRCWTEVFQDDHVCLHQQSQHNPYKSHLVRWTSNVPASRRSYLCGYSLIIPFSTSARPKLNLGKQLNFNSLNLFWGPQNLLLKLGETLCQPQTSENFLWLHPVVSAGFAIKFVS